MSAEPRRYLTHDMDQGRVELVVQSGDNGDWYVSIVPEGWKIARLAGFPGETPHLHSCVRVTTSGERSGHIGAANAVADLYRAMGGETAERLRTDAHARNNDGVEPLSEGELHHIEQWSERTNPAYVARLLATIRARDEEIARLRSSLVVDAPEAAR